MTRSRGVANLLVRCSELRIQLRASSQLGDNLYFGRSEPWELGHRLHTADAHGSHSTSQRVKAQRPATDHHRGRTVPDDDVDDDDRRQSQCFAQNPPALSFKIALHPKALFVVTDSLGPWSVTLSPGDVVTISRPALLTIIYRSKISLQFPL